MVEIAKAENQRTRFSLGWSLTSLNSGPIRKSRLIQSFKLGVKNKFSSLYRLCHSSLPRRTYPIRRGAGCYATLFHHVGGWIGLSLFWPRHKKSESDVCILMNKCHPLLSSLRAFCRARWSFGLILYETKNSSNTALLNAISKRAKIGTAMKDQQGNVDQLTTEKQLIKMHTAYKIAYRIFPL